jgi:hypothetical protein
MANQTQRSAPRPRRGRPAKSGPSTVEVPGNGGIRETKPKQKKRGPDPAWQVR